jgi:LysR family transcriptional activator of nhaA
LQYFWVVAHEGSVVKAAERLHITPQTISGQIRLLEEAIEQPLFNRVGRRLVLSEMGHVVLEYADEIFSIGAELGQVVRENRSAGPAKLSVGIVNSIPKLIAERIVAPTLVGEDAVRIRCEEAPLEELLGELSVHKLDIVLSDQPMPVGFSLRAFNHRLGESGLSFFSQRRLAKRYKKDFPASLDGAPMLLPGPHSALRRRLNEWFDSNSIVPRIVGEVDDSALLKAFGEAGHGLFAAPSAIEGEICKMYNMAVVGRTEDVTEQFFAISPERRIKHPSVARIIEAARTQLFRS